MHNEAANIAVLAQQLTRSTVKPIAWIVVDDGSSDDSRGSLSSVPTDVNTIVLTRDNAGGLIGGSAFTAWQYGVDHALSLYPDLSYIMKLDADVELPSDYLQKVLETFADSPEIALVGGVLIEKADREQTIHVPGPVKMYSAAGYRSLDSVPRVVGFDVMDEIAIKDAGLKVIVRKDLPFRVRRPIGASQGLVHGRRRNGQVCKWTGYWTPYFVLHATRYAFRKPYFVGSFAMIAGYLKASASPYSEHLRRAHALEQRGKLKNAIASPRKWLKSTYGVKP
ncbi:glycosyltransferase family A protein [Rhodococcus globerulus]|uniref:glycosyltransferase family A protein n=1 Tax=Rhodococcus globerulus TaxID=33008 RepID=UPI001401DD79|nr:glycosyltransferase family A protein [Rhodococcus globerulus]